MTALLLLGITSLVVFEPVTTVAAVLAANAPPRELIRQALPLSLAFSLAIVILLCGLWARALAEGIAVCVTTLVLVLFLGLNLSILGLVEPSSQMGPLLIDLVALTVLLGAVYALAYATLEALMSAHLSGGLTCG